MVLTTVTGNSDDMGNQLSGGSTGASAASAAVAAHTSQAVTPRNVPHRGGALAKSALDLAVQFPDAVERTEVIWNETTVYVRADQLHQVVRWLHDEPAQAYNYLVDITAVEYRDYDRPIEVVWHLRSLTHLRFLRLKVELPKRGPLQVDSVTDIYKSADWLERECYDMFGIKFSGHPDLRRILLWENYREGFPLRKDFPLRGRFSRAEQLKQVLTADPEARYSMEELTIADAYDSLPDDMRRRLAQESEGGAIPEVGE